MKKEEIIRAIATIQREIHEMPQPPRVSTEDVEDISDNYQDNLEYNWWLRDKKDELEKLQYQLKNLEG